METTAFFGTIFSNLSTLFLSNLSQTVLIMLLEDFSGCHHDSSHCLIGVLYFQQKNNIPLRIRAFCLISVTSACQHSALRDILLQSFLPSCLALSPREVPLSLLFLFPQSDASGCRSPGSNYRQGVDLCLCVAQPVRSRQRPYLDALNKVILSPGEVEDHRAATHSTRSTRTR